MQNYVGSKISAQVMPGGSWVAKGGVRVGANRGSTQASSPTFGSPGTSLSASDKQHLDRSTTLSLQPINVLLLAASYLTNFWVTLWGFLKMGGEPLGPNVACRRSLEKPLSAPPGHSNVAPGGGSYKPQNPQNTRPQKQSLCSIQGNPWPRRAMRPSISHALRAALQAIRSGLKDLLGPPNSSLPT